MTAEDRRRTMLFLCAILLAGVGANIIGAAAAITRTADNVAFSYSALAWPARGP